MAVAYKTLFRVVQIFKGNIQRDVVLHEPRPVRLGEHAGCDLVGPLPGGEAELVVAEPVGDRFRVHLRGAKGAAALEGKVHRRDGTVLTSRDGELDSGPVELAPGDWCLLDVVGADELQIFCQFVRVPVPKTPNPVLRPLVGVKDTAVVLLSQLDQYTVLAAVTILAFLLMTRLHIPHGADLESDRINRRFTALIRKSPQRRFHKRKLGIQPIKRRTVVREAREMSRRSTNRTPRAERAALRRRSKVSPRLNKGAVKALNRAMLSSDAVRRTFRDQGGVMVKLDEALAGLDRGNASGGAGGGDGVADPLATRSSGGGSDSVGATSTGGGPRLGTPVRNRGTIGGRSDRRVRVARIGIGGGSVSGTGLNKASIGRVVRSRRGSIKYCYERVLRTNPTIGSGKITVSFKIGPNGRVIAARVAGSSLKDGGRVGSCITRAIRRWPFPKSQGYAMVRYPFLFSSGLK